VKNLLSLLERLGTGIREEVVIFSSTEVQPPVKQ
jgi:hypothetical protein